MSPPMAEQSDVRFEQLAPAASLTQKPSQDERVENTCMQISDSRKSLLPLGQQSLVWTAGQWSEAAAAAAPRTATILRCWSRPEGGTALSGLRSAGRRRLCAAPSPPAPHPSPPPALPATPTPTPNAIN